MMRPARLISAVGEGSISAPDRCAGQPMLVEHRRSERSYTRLPITLRIGPTDNPADRIGSTVDVSHHGARIVTNADLRAGQILEIFVYRGNFRPVRVQVVWVRASTSGPGIEAGLKFLD
jgi:hypothetical protein